MSNMYFETVEFRQPEDTHVFSSRLALRRKSATSLQCNKIRVLVIGASSVGKSTLIKQLTERRFKEDFSMIDDRYQDDEGAMIVELMEIDVNLVDTLKELAIQTTQAYILIYSFENPVESFDYISKIKQEIDELKGDGMPIVLVSNKADTLHGQVLQTSKQSEVYVWGLPHTEISLITGMNIGEVYRHLFTHPILQRMVDVVSLINASSVASCVRRMSLPAFHVQERRSFTCIKVPSEGVPETLSENTPEAKRQFPETPTLRKQPTSKWSKFQRFFARLKVRKY